MVRTSKNGLKCCCSCRNDGEIRCVSEGKKCDGVGGGAAAVGVQAPILDVIIKCFYFFVEK